MVVVAGMSSSKLMAAAPSSSSSVRALMNYDLSIIAPVNQEQITHALLPEQGMYREQVMYDEVSDLDRKQ